MFNRQRPTTAARLHWVEEFLTAYAVGDMKFNSKVVNDLRRARTSLRKKFAQSKKECAA